MTNSAVLISLVIFNDVFFLSNKFKIKYLNKQLLL